MNSYIFLVKVQTLNRETQFRLHKTMDSNVDAFDIGNAKPCTYRGIRKFAPSKFVLCTVTPRFVYIKPCYLALDMAVALALALALAVALALALFLFLLFLLFLSLFLLLLLLLSMLLLLLFPN